MRKINIDNWKREKHYKFFNTFKNPYFAVTIPFNVTKTYQFSKENNVSFFAAYLHSCMKAVNTVENFKYRIVDDEVIVYDIIHASATILRSNKTFGFSFIPFSDDLNTFITHIEKEKTRIENSDELHPPIDTLDCVYCSAMPWFNFTGHKEPVSGRKESVPMIAFSKAEKQNNDLIMNVAITVNHALADGYHIGLFAEKFQYFLNNRN